MKLIDVINDSSRTCGKEYLLLGSVTDDDAAILVKLGMVHIEDYDAMDYDGNNFEAWIKTEYIMFVE